MTENEDRILSHIGSSASLERFNIAAKLKVASEEEKAQLQEVQTRALAELDTLPTPQKEAVLFLASIKREIDQSQIHKIEPNKRALAEKSFYIVREIELNRNNLDALVAEKAEITAFAHEKFSGLDAVKKADILHTALVEKQHDSNITQEKPLNDYIINATLTNISGGGEMQATMRNEYQSGMNKAINEMNMPEGTKSIIVAEAPVKVVPGGQLEKQLLRQERHKETQRV